MNTFLAQAVMILLLMGCKTHPTTSELKEAWTKEGAPSRLDLESNKPLKFNDLPLSSTFTRHEIWSGHYWPRMLGGLSFRWQENNQISWEILKSSIGFSYNLPPIITPAEAKNLTDEEIAKLSPAEKVDIFFGRDRLKAGTNFPFTRRQQNQTRYRSFRDHLKVMQGQKVDEKKPEAWRGICDGWANAAIQEKEPGPQATLTNRRGQKIIFYRDDIKALLSYAYHWYKAEDYGMIGEQCNSGQRNYFRRPSECRDYNAGSFHQTLGEQLGVKGNSFIVDLSRGRSVWNHPVLSYESVVRFERDLDPLDSSHIKREKNILKDRYERCIKRSAWIDRQRRAHLRHVDKVPYHPDTTKILSLKTKIVVANENTPHLSKNRQETKSKTYFYDLELNKEGHIVGGEWGLNPVNCVIDYPDYAWRQIQKSDLRTSLMPKELAQYLLIESLKKSAHK